MTGALIAAALLQAAAPAAPPSPPALELAHALGGWAQIGDNTVEQARSTLARKLLFTHAAWRGVGCDPENAGCRAAAERIAAEVAPGVLASRRAAADRMLAIMLDERMSADQIRAATAFVGTPAGKALATALQDAGQPARLSPATQQRLMAVMAEAGAVNDRALLDRFFDETKSLPRGRTPVAPPPPVPSPAPRP